MSTNKIANLDFIEIIERLMCALHLKREYELANLLGFKKDTFSARKLRNAVPVDKIRLLCKTRGLNENWVFYGEGDMYLPEGVPPHVNDSTPKHNSPPRNDRIPALTEKQLEMARLISALPDEEQDKAIADLKKKIIEYLSGNIKED